MTWAGSSNDERATSIALRVVTNSEADGADKVCSAQFHWAGVVYFSNAG